MKKLFVLLSFVTFFASADPIKIIVGYAPGGANDTSARILSKQLTAENIENLVINQNGANGRIALNNVLHQKPDGNTLLFASSSMMLASVENPEFNADVHKLVAVDKFAELGYMMVVKKDSRIHTWQDLTQALRTKQVSIGASGTTVTKFISELWPNNTNINVIPYNSDNETLMGLLSETVDVALVTPVYIARVESGELNALALTTVHGQFGIKSLRELGVPLDCQIWNGVFAPPGTPADVVQKLYSEIEHVKNNEKVRLELWNAIHSTIPKKQTPEDFNKSIELEYPAKK